MGSLIPDNRLAQFMDQTIIDTRFFVLDWWSFVHFGVGAILGFLFQKIPKLAALDQGMAFLIVLLVLTLYEFFEFAFRGIAFDAETMVNIVWDIIFGMAGYLLVRFIMNGG